MIIDCHGHYNTQADFLRNAKKYATDEWGRRVLKAIAAQPNRAEEVTSEEAWIESLDRYGVDKVVLQVAPFGGNDAVGGFIKSCKNPERFIGVANIDFMDPAGSNSAQELERCVKELGLKGIGELYPNVGPWDPGDEKCFPVYEKAQELGVPIMMHFGMEPFPAPFNHQRFNDPYLLDPALRAFPDLDFIICHMAGDRVGDLLGLMHCRRNVYAEISSFTAHIPTPRGNFGTVTPQMVMQGYLRSGYAERLLWATDVQGPYYSEVAINSVQGENARESYAIKILKEINASEEDIEKILGGNAERVFKLS